MKTPTFLFVSVLTLCTLTFTACQSGGSGGDSSDAEEKQTEETASENANQGELEGLVPLDLKPYDLPFTLLIPDSTTGVPKVVNQSWGSTEIQVGKKYQLEIALGGDLNLLKSDLKNDDMYTHEVLEETPTSIVYRSVIAGSGLKPEHHFYSVVTINGEQYEVKDMKSGGPYGERSARRMMEAANQMGAGS